MTDLSTLFIDSRGLLFEAYQRDGDLVTVAYIESIADSSWSDSEFFFNYSRVGQFDISELLFIDDFLPF